MTNTVDSSLTFGVGGQRDTVNNPTTRFRPRSHISRSLGPWGTATIASVASDTCWPLPSLPDWQMAAPLDENDKWLSVSRKDFLLTCDPHPDSWPLSGVDQPATTPPPSLPLSPQACVSASRPPQVQVRTKWCGEQLLFLWGRKERTKTDERGRRAGACCSAVVREKREGGGTDVDTDKEREGQKPSTQQYFNIFCYFISPALISRCSLPTSFPCI